MQGVWLVEVLNWRWFNGWGLPVSTNLLKHYVMELCHWDTFGEWFILQNVICECFSIFGNNKIFNFEFPFPEHFIIEEMIELSAGMSEVDEVSSLQVPSNCQNWRKCYVRKIIQKPRKPYYVLDWIIIKSLRHISDIAKW